VKEGGRRGPVQWGTAVGGWRADGGRKKDEKMRNDSTKGGTGGGGMIQEKKIDKRAIVRVMLEHVALRARKPRRRAGIVAWVKQGGQKIASIMRE